MGGALAGTAYGVSGAVIFRESITPCVTVCNDAQARGARVRVVRPYVCRQQRKRRCGCCLLNEMNIAHRTKERRGVASDGAHFFFFFLRFGGFCEISGGVAAARSGLFYGVWLGGMFGLFRNHVASLKEQARMAEEDERLAQVKTASMLPTQAPGGGARTNRGPFGVVPLWRMIDS